AGPCAGTPGRAARGNRVLYRAEESGAAAAPAAILQPGHGVADERRDERRVLAEALVRPAPALVLPDVGVGGERHGEAHRRDLGCGGSGHLLDERPVPRGAQRDLLGKDGGSGDLGVSVHRVDAEDERDLEARTTGGRTVLTRDVE